MAVFAEQELITCVIANAQGDILTVNAEARARVQAFPGTRSEQFMKPMFANPPAIAVRG
ncbi:hypothetical protein [Ruegeria arenilitoris]|uniref:hypothetical protein n=1 Tax=Ruegeria arenilitoris TaxID=1173585 RepID=UPI00148080B0|nr:hypothetical protein [Ruegeria arenilitoris]